MAEERRQRYSAATRAEQAATRRDRTARSSFGATYEQQGIRPQKEQGQAFLKRQELKARYGAFANPTWQYEDRGGQLYRKPLPRQSGRIAEQGGTAQWEPVPDYVQRSYANPRRRAFFEQHPEYANQPGGGQDYWSYAKRLGNMQIDPATGLRVNRFGELYDPSLMGQPGYTGGAIGQQGMGVDPRFGGGFTPQQAPPMAPPPMPQTGGGFMAPNLGNLGGMEQRYQYMNPYAQPGLGYGYQPMSLGNLGGMGRNPTPAPQRPMFQGYGQPSNPFSRTY